MNLDWLSSVAPGLVVALAAGLFQYARVPTLNRRIERHVKLRADLPDGQWQALDELLTDEVSALIKRDRAWLSPKNVAAATIRRMSSILAIATASWGVIYALVIQSREDRLATGNYGELASVGAVVILFTGYVLASVFDGISPKDAMFRSNPTSVADAEEPQATDGAGGSPTSR